MATIVRLAATGAGPLRRDRLPPGAEHQALARRPARHAVAPLDRLRPLRHARAAPVARTAACWARKTSRRCSGPASSSSGSATSCTSTPARPPTCSTRFEQVRIAAALGYQPVAGLLPVEQFMREYFRHTNQVSHVVARFVAKATSAEWSPGCPRPCSGHHVEAGRARRSGGDHGHRAAGLQKLRGNLVGDRPPGRPGQPLRRADRAGHLGIHPPRGAAIQSASRRRRPAAVSSPCCRIPAGWARCSATCTAPPSWNASFPSSPAPAACCNSTSITSTRSTSIACGRWSSPRSLAGDQGPLGRVYRGIAEKHVLHLALLIHDLGKGYLEDHREIGLKIAERGGPAARPARPGGRER